VLCSLVVEANDDGDGGGGGGDDDDDDDVQCRFNSCWDLFESLVVLGRLSSRNCRKDST